MKKQSNSLSKLNQPSKLLTILILIWAGWRAVLFGIASLADRFLPYKPSFPYAEVLLLNRNLPTWIASWANFDGVHYLTIIEKGYLGTGLIQAFFPLFPVVVWLVSLTTLDTLLAGLVVSNLLTVVFLLMVYKYVADKTTTTQAWWTIAAVLLFPTAFFLGASYTESLFLVLVFSSLWAAQKNQWLLAGLLAAGASATRLVGVFLVPALIVELWQSQPDHVLTFIKKNKTALAQIMIGTLGLASYMVYLALVFNDPLYFYHVQSEFGSGRQESIVLLPQVLWRYLKIIVTYRPFDLKYFAFIQELAFTLLSYFGLWLARHKVRWSWTFFAAMAITLPTLTGNLSSMPRYVLVALPLYWLLGEKLTQGNWLWKFVLLVSTLLLVVNTLLFIQGYWVA